MHQRRDIGRFRPFLTTRSEDLGSKVDMGNVGLIRFAAVFFILYSLPLQGEDFSRYNQVAQYDKYFSKYSKRSFGPAFDWRHFKAQAVAESGLRKDARSQAGAVGLMQIMPDTYEEIVKQNRHVKGSGKEPKWSIAAGIDYNRSIWLLFKEKRPFQDRLDFMFGAYNAGKGNIFQAQRRAKRKGLDPNRWRTMESILPSVTGRHSKETINYVGKIKKIKEVLN